MTLANKFFLALGAVFFIACEEEAFHSTYVEKNIFLKTPEILEAQGNILPLEWTKPEGWVESLGDQMRQASFLVVHEGEVGECTVVQLAGPGGDVPSNIKRWMGQLKIIPLSTEEMADFIAKQDSLYLSDGTPGMVVDLTKMMGGDMTSNKSIIGAIFPLEDNTLFVKMMGEKSILLANKEKLWEFVASLKIGKRSSKPLKKLETKPLTEKVPY